MKYILVPTDFSPAANNAVRYAIQFARAKKMQIKFFHAAHSLRNIHEFMEEDPAGYKKLEDKARADLNRKVLEAYKKVGIKSGNLQLIVKVGESFEGCLAEALAENKIAMIVMGTHGKTNFKDMILGSNASHVVATSTVPVLCVPGNSKYAPVKTLAYFTDLSNVKDEMKRVSSIAKTLACKTSVIHIDYSWARTAEEERLLKRLASSRNDFHNIKASISIPLTQHVKRIVRDKSTLPCLFHDHKNVFSRLLSGSNPEEAPARVHAPILSLQRKV